MHYGKNHSAKQPIRGAPDPVSECREGFQERIPNMTLK